MNSLELLKEEPLAAKPAAIWDELTAKISLVKHTAETLTVTSSTQKDLIAQARKTRLALREIRIAVNKHHKDLKEGILAAGRSIDANKNSLIAVIEPLEQRMQAQEEFAEREAQRIRKELHEKRLSELRPFTVGAIIVDLAAMSEQEFTALLESSREQSRIRIEREREAREAQARTARAAMFEDDAPRAEPIRAQAMPIQPQQPAPTQPKTDPSRALLHFLSVVRGQAVILLNPMKEAGMEKEFVDTMKQFTTAIEAIANKVK